MVVSSMFYLSLIYSFVLLLTRQVSCEEFSQCYNDVNICLWTDGSVLSQSAAQAACQQRNDSFLSRITSSYIQSKLAQFRVAAPSNLLGVNGFWTGVKAAGISSFHWIDESPLSAGGSVNGQSDSWARFAVISYDQNSRQFVFSARRWDRTTSSYICQLQQGPGCRPPGDLVMNSKCYKKFLSQQQSWFSASNDCLSRGGSLAVFANIGRPSDNSQLTNWLNTSGTDNSYWVGLLRSWWKTTDEDGRSVDVQYSNWQIDYPQNAQDRGRCVIVTQSNKWFPYQCNEPQRYVCQNYPRPVSSTTTTTTSTTPSIVDVLNNVLGRLSRQETGLSRLQSGHTNALSRLRQLETGNTNVVSRLTRLQADITQLRNAPMRVRLAGSSSSRPSAGRLEVYHNGVWGTVCDDYFGLTDAHVACRMLGFRSGVYIGRQYGSGRGQIWLDDLRCTGSEWSLAECRHKGWGIHNCGHNEDVSVRCSNGCPSGFTYVSSVRGCYKIVLANLDWARAGLWCKAHHPAAHLVFINSAAEQQAIKTMVSGINDDVCSYYPGDSRHAELFWIGGQRVDLSYASNFVWKKTPGCSDRDCVSELTYTHWEQGEPNNRGDFIGNYERTSPTVPEKCLQFRSNRDYTWNDGSCELAACSICEIDL